MKWLITAAREQQKNKNKNARMYKKLAKELIDAYNNEVRKRLAWSMSNNMYVARIKSYMSVMNECMDSHGHSGNIALINCVYSSLSVRNYCKTQVEVTNLNQRPMSKSTLI